jgi:hypothetical protein
MDRDLVFRKTEKGADAIAVRGVELPQRLRTILVLVDGKQTVGMLLDRFGGLSGLRAALEQLPDLGFIERVLESPARSPAASNDAAVR